MQAVRNLLCEAMINGELEPGASLSSVQLAKAYWDHPDIAARGPAGMVDPLRQTRALPAQRRVVSMARVEPRVVRQFAEDPRLQVVHQ